MILFDIVYTDGEFCAARCRVSELAAERKLLTSELRTDRKESARLYWRSLSNFDDSLNCLPRWVVESDHVVAYKILDEGTLYSEVSKCWIAFPRQHRMDSETESPDYIRSFFRRFLEHCLLSAVQHKLVSVRIPWEMTAGHDKESSHLLRSLFVQALESVIFDGECE